MSSTQTFAIVGASLAGAKAAETLRQAGFDGRVLLLGAERERPYERPPLSKDYARGDSPREKVYVHPAGFYDEHGIELHTSTPVQAIDTAAREFALRSGERVRFDRLLLATGAKPRRLHVPGSDLDGVLYLRDLSDADAIAERIARGGRLVVIGGGWIAGFASSTGPMHLIKGPQPPRACSATASPMTGCPSSTPTSTTSGCSTRATRRTGTRSCSAATRPSTSSSPSGSRRAAWWQA